MSDDLKNGEKALNETDSDNVRSTGSDEDMRLVEDLITRFDEKLAKINHLSESELYIRENVVKILQEHNISIYHTEKLTKSVRAKIHISNYIFSMLILIENEKICFQLKFPLRVQGELMATVTSHILRYNNEKAISMLKLNSETGGITMEYATLCSRPELFDAVSMWNYISVLIQEGREQYIKLSKLIANNNENDGDEGADADILSIFSPAEAINRSILMERKKDEQILEDIPLFYDSDGKRRMPTFEEFVEAYKKRQSSRNQTTQK